MPIIMTSRILRIIADRWRQMEIVKFIVYSGIRILYNVLTFIKPTPASYPSLLTYKILIIFWNTNWNDVWLECNRLIESGNENLCSAYILFLHYSCILSCLVWLTSAEPSRTQKFWGQIWGDWQQFEPSCLGRSRVHHTHH